ncbi:MAG: hypothetical protein ABI629_23350 [bacterium]
MPKSAISVTIDAANLLWLRAQVHAVGRKSVSDVLDGLVTEARTGGRVHEAAIRSVVGTVTLPAADPDLAGAAAAVRALFAPPLRTGSRRTPRPAGSKRPARRG